MLHLGNDAFQNMLLIFWEVMVGLQTPQSHDQVAPTVCDADVPIRGKDSSESVEVPSLAPSVNQTADRCGGGIVVVVGAALASGLCWRRSLSRGRNQRGRQRTGLAQSHSLGP
jgi:hypothetical protein